MQHLYTEEMRRECLAAIGEHLESAKAAFRDTGSIRDLTNTLAGVIGRIEANYYVLSTMDEDAVA